MGTRTVWLCLACGIACSPNPAADAELSANEIRSHEVGDDPHLTSADAAVFDAAEPDGGLNGSSDAASPVPAPVDAASPLDAGNLESPPLDAAGIAASECDANTSCATASDSGAYPADAATTANADASMPDAATDAASDASVCVVPDILGSECDLATNCGCDSGMVCRTANQQTGQTLCFEPGETPAYSPCDFDQDCGMGEVCEAGLCRPQCANLGHYCEDGSSCATFADGGRSVCAGHCNVLTRSPAVWSNAERWVKYMTRQQEGGLREEFWTADYTSCGEGAYCHPGIGPDEASSQRPVYPHCVPARGHEVDNSYCTVNEDCVSGLACGRYPGEIQGRCIRIGFVEEDCRETGHGFELGTNVDGSVFISPDGRSQLGLCTKNVR